MSKSKKQLDEIVDELLNNRLELTSFVSEGLVQDKHVQELEEENKMLKAIETGHELQIEILQNQNKRYRGKINTALNMLQGTGSDNIKVNNVEHLLTETLEEAE